MFQQIWISWVIFLAIVLVSDGSVHLGQWHQHNMLRYSYTDVPVPPDRWFPQRLDHFQPTDTRTWCQRYQVVKDYYKEGGPVFLMIGGEGEANPISMVQGAWIDYAKKYNALMFQLEHRYYGKSHPTSDLSVDNLKYLSSEQALADLAYFIVSRNSHYKLPSNTKWVAFGGSYPGNLAAWLRYKYPHLVHAAVASSAPVLARVDIPEYMDVVKNSLATYSWRCVEAIEAANKHIRFLLKTPIGRKFIEKEFLLCDPIDPNNLTFNDVTNLLENLAGTFESAVQYNDGYQQMCDVMVNRTLGFPVRRFAAVKRLRTSYCLDYKYKNLIRRQRSITWSEGGWERQWRYQKCTEFGFFHTSESIKALFDDDLPVGFFIQQCRDIFGEAFTKEFIYRAVDRSNMIYGGLDLKATRVVYVHGSLDPWHALGITKTRIPESPVIYINGTTHCEDMGTKDSPVLNEARKEISTLIGKWLQET